MAEQQQDDLLPYIAEDFNKHVRPFIDLVDRLRQHGLEQDISLPCIVVVGDQSSGKSSVLEALSGVQLPRGAGIVTRCPLELRLKSAPADAQWRGRIKYQPQGHEFDNDEDDFGVDESFDSPAEVENRVRTAQNLLAGPDRGISSARINLEIISADVPDLTLIDLPGITRLNVQGQQLNVGFQIKKMIDDYITKEQTIILAVVPANVDIATTEALQMAREVDPEGRRTLGVVTKPDLVDPGAEEEIMDVVSNTRYQLRRGYTMVKCRGQTQIKNHQTLVEALDQERRFFTDHTQFRNLTDSLCGMRNLSKKLTSVLVEHIKECIPHLQDEVRSKLESVNRDLAKLGDGLPTARHELTIVLTRTLQNFIEMLGKVSTGDTQFGDDSFPDLNPFKRARQSFSKFSDEVNKSIPRETDKHFMKRIKDKIDKLRGRELPRFVNYQACEELIKEEIKKFQPHSKVCLREVSELMTEILVIVTKRTTGHYRDLERRIKDIMLDYQQKARDSCDKEIDKIFKQEALVYTQDRTFSATYDCVLEINHELEAANAQQRPARPLQVKIPNAVRAMTLFNTPFDPEANLNEEAEHMYEMIMSYMNVCGKRVCDTVPMTILYCMVKELCDQLKADVWTILADDPSRLLSEEPELAIRREGLRKKAERLQNAQQELRRF